VHSDHLNTPQVVSDAQGSVIWRADYSPFGQANVSQNRIAFNLRFPGQYYDEESGLHYNWHRYYDPQTGRYLTSDPIGLVGGLNTYRYARNNPFGLIDPDGLSVLLAPTQLLSGSGAAAGGAGQAGMGGIDWSPSNPWVPESVADSVRDRGFVGWCLLTGCIPSPLFNEGQDDRERGLPPEGVVPPVENPDKCTVGPASRPSEQAKGGKSIWDEDGGEWRYAPEDKWHNPHWDYNPHNAPNSPWQNVPIDGLPPRK
jgi:RHS repeat-associated protein